MSEIGDDVSGKKIESMRGDDEIQTANVPDQRTENDEKNITNAREKFAPPHTLHNIALCLLARLAYEVLHRPQRADLQRPIA